MTSKEQKRPANIFEDALDYLWNGLGLEEKGWKRLKKGDFKKKMKNGLTYQIWFDRSRYNYIDYEIGHGNVEVGFTGIDDDIHVGAVHQVFQDAKLLFGTSRHQIFIIYLFVLRSTAIQSHVKTRKCLIVLLKVLYLFHDLFENFGAVLRGISRFSKNEPELRAARR